MHSISDALLFIIFNATGILFPEKEVYLRRYKNNCLKYIMRYCCWLFSNKAPQYKNRWEYNRQQRLRLAWACLFVCSVGGGAPVGSTFLAAHAFLFHRHTIVLNSWLGTFRGGKGVFPSRLFDRHVSIFIMDRRFSIKGILLVPNILYIWKI